jgi:hypothetical protein
MYQLRDSAPLTVTFDTNTLDAVVSPDTAQRGTGSCGTIVQDAIRAGRIRGFFSETVFTLEGITNADRPDVLGKTGIAFRSSSSGPNQITSEIAVRHFRKPLDPRAFDRIQRALTLGMQPLRTAARFGGYRSPNKDYATYEPDGGISELVCCMEEVNALTTEIMRRGLGTAAAIKLGLQFSERDGVTGLEFFQQGLGRAKDKRERKRVAAVVREWADGESIAAHYGFGMQLFCSEDSGRSTPSRSVLDTENRQWLSTTFGIQFITLAELAGEAA